jgi:hypothetical protein
MNDLKLEEQPENWTPDEYMNKIEICESIEWEVRAINIERFKGGILWDCIRNSDIIEYVVSSLYCEEHQEVNFKDLNRIGTSLGTLSKSPISSANVV